MAPKQVDQFLCGWCQSLAFFKLYMIHVKKQKIDQDKAKSWGVEECPYNNAPHCIGQMKL
jgi:hypothetical protein